MTRAEPRVLTINGGSSSIKFALFAAGGSLRRILAGSIANIGLPHGSFTVKGSDNDDNFSREVPVPDYPAAVSLLADWLQGRMENGALNAVGHRVVHGGPKYWEPRRLTPEVLAALRQFSPLDPEHLPQEILLAESLGARFPEVPQIACFDTEFHHDMPRVARLLPIPRRYDTQGVRRYGFHGLSCAYLLEELARAASPAAAQARLILAHLGSGASMTAVHAAKSIDTSMGFTPAAGLPMGSRSGDLDPGLARYFARTEGQTSPQFDHMVNHESGLLGISETSSDVRDLLAHEASDVRAAEALALFCYQAKKWIGAYVAVLGGLDTLVFAGGIGENAAPVRARICAGLGCFGIEIDEARNSAHESVISADASQVAVRVIRTDEELMIARSVCHVCGLDS